MAQHVWFQTERVCQGLMMKGQKTFLHRYRLAVVATVAAILGCAALPAEAAWETAHADGGNTGFADVVTRPAGRGSVSVPELGTFGPGAGPVIAPDGTVYIGNQQGRLFALRADGKPAWSRELPAGQVIMASPAVGADGSIYVVGVQKFRDHRVDPPVTVFESTLHKFLPGGGWVWHTRFPEHFSGHGLTSAPPNIVRAAGQEAVIVPVIYPNRVTGGHGVRVIAFSTDGAVLHDAYVSTFVQTLAADSPCVFILLPSICIQPPGFSGQLPPADPAHQLPSNTPLPLPGVAIFTFAGGGAPWVVVSDLLNHVVGYTFNYNLGFTETFRTHDPARTMLSPPMVLPDGHSLVGTSDGIVFAGPAGTKWPALGLGAIAAAPTRLADGRVVVVPYYGSVTVLNGPAVLSQIPRPGQSIASAAASRNHVFVATASAFLTYDRRTMAEVSRLDWVGGGLWPPAIGPQGHVYAIASNVLFVFPPP
jgi:hypothetical protein